MRCTLSSCFFLLNFTKGTLSAPASVRSLDLVTEAIGVCGTRSPVRHYEMLDLLPIRRLEFPGQKPASARDRNVEEERKLAFLRPPGSSRHEDFYGRVPYVRSGRILSPYCDEEKVKINFL